MLTLLLIETPDKTSAQSKAELTLSISPDKVDFEPTPVDEARSAAITVSANAETVISDVSLSSETKGLSLKQTCTTMGQISEKLPCEITVTWKPSEKVADGKNVVNIKFYDANGSKDMEKLETVNVSFSTKPEDVPVVKAADPTPVIEEEEEEEEEEEPAPAPSVVTRPAPESKAETPKPKMNEECYQFAFAGYNSSGKQIGWIKPEGGHYMFHPFSDTDCAEPTGEYNPDTGFIMALDDPTKKIGSDAERIGGRGAGANLRMPVLSNPAPTKKIFRATQLDAPTTEAMSAQVFTKPKPQSDQLPSSFDEQATVSSRPYDRTFVLRHFKPIPATIVNEVRAVDPAKGRFSMIPVQATVDRHVYSDNGRTIVVPAGTLMLGNVVGDVPGPYKSIGRISINWYRFVRPDGVEFNFVDETNRPFSGDSQGRVGVPGYGSSDYLEQMVLPLLTAIVPAATNLIAPISDRIVNQIDLDNNVVVQSGTLRSSELAKQEMIKSWNKVTEKLFIDMLDNTVPPFSIASGTRITVFSPTDLIVAWCDGDACAPTEPVRQYAAAPTTPRYTYARDDPRTIMGQVRSYTTPEGAQIEDARLQALMKGFTQYQSKNMAAQDAYSDYLNVQGGVLKSDGTVLSKGTEEYNKEVLGIKYKELDDGNKIMLNPSASLSEAKPAPPIADPSLTCDGGTPPDKDGCCPGETYTDMGAEGWNCCPDGDLNADCFPPMEVTN
jgi:type IV secretory pathway VirB10-like protein